MSNSKQSPYPVPVTPDTGFPFTFQVLVNGTPIAAIVCYAQNLNDARQSAARAVSVEITDQLLQVFHVNHEIRM